MFLVVCALSAVCAYAVGSIPLSRLASTSISMLFPDAGGKTFALARVLADIAKGFAAVTAFCTIIGHEYAQFGVLFAYLGHLYPYCPRCNSGKGIGLLLGAMVALDPIVGLIALLAWLFTYYVFRYATLAALVAAFVTPIISSIVGLGVEIYVLYLIAAMIFLRLRVSLRLLLDGSERMVAWRVENA